MAPPHLDSHCFSSSGIPFSGSVSIHNEEACPAKVFPALHAPNPNFSCDNQIPKPPPLPSKTYERTKSFSEISGFGVVPKETRDAWDKLFKEGVGADIYIVTEEKLCIPAHSSILMVASDVLKNLVSQSRVKNGMRYMKITGVPHDAVFQFVRFLYSSCYEEEEIKKFVLPLLVLSHSYSIPALKRICVDILEQGWLTRENVVDVLQLARNCDAPRLSLICVRMILKDFAAISSTEGWKVMRHANPLLEQELVEALVEVDTYKQERQRKLEERKVYLQLHQAMEALLHICRDGCRTIGPRDQELNMSQINCNYPACKGLENLVRHLSNCKDRVPGGCVHCKRMWQLLELHSRMCSEPDTCKVPLCRHFAEKIRQQSKKEEAKWRLLVSKVVAARNTLGPFVPRISGLL